MRSLAAVLLTLLLLAMPSCLFGSSTETDYHGKHVSLSQMEQVETGSTKTEVLEMFGEPSRQSKLEDGADLWSWRYTKETKSSGGLFLIFGSSSKTKEHGTVYARFREDKVEKVWRTDT